MAGESRWPWESAQSAPPPNPEDYLDLSSLLAGTTDGGEPEAPEDTINLWADTFASDATVVVRPRPRCLPASANLVTLDHAPGLDLNAVCDLWEVPDGFMQFCLIQTEDQDFRPLTPTPAQMELIEAYHRHNWVMVTKYRQAKVSTVSLMLLLRDCMYIAGLEGRIVAEKLDTAMRLMQRLKIAYKYLPDHLKVPLEPGTEFTNSKVRFRHGGSIQIITAATDSPGVGDSIDRLVMTEFGEVPLAFQANVLANLFPTINKRPNAKFILETTPGKSGTQHQSLWRSALEGKNKFHALFLRWWLDISCTYPLPPDFAMTEEEEAYAERHPGITPSHIQYRRVMLQQDFAGAPHKFPSKFPSHADDGWLGSGVQVLPHEPLEKMLLTSVQDGFLPLDACGLRLLPGAVYRPGRPYMITADPGNFAAKGDYSSAILWDAIDGKEIGVFEQREDPVLFAHRIMRAGIAWGEPGNPALLVVESNAAATVAVCVNEGYANLHYERFARPGWNASGKSLREGEGALIKALHDETLFLSFAATVLQCRDYDGSDKDRRVKDEDGNTSHFERARCVAMAAYIFSKHRFVDRSAEVETAGYVVRQSDRQKPDDESQQRVIRVSDFAPRKPRTAVVSPYAPPPRR